MKYYKNKKIEGNPETFKPLNDAIAVDANFIFAIKAIWGIIILYLRSVFTHSCVYLVFR